MSTLRILALDIGTSSVRATVYSEHLRPAGPAAQVRYQWHVAAGGAVDLPAVRLERVVQKAIGGAVATHRGAIDIVATSAFWHSLMGVDADGRAVTAVLPWTDTRASAEATALRERLDEAAVHARTGCRLHPTYWPARLRWFKAHDPRTFARVRRWTSFPAYLQGRWLGRRDDSVSQASGTGMLAAGTWDAELCRACDVEPGHLGEVIDVDARHGELRGQWAHRWPALKAARWIPALGDGALNNVGAECVDGTRAALMIGTSGALRLAWRTGTAPAVPPSLWRYWIDRDRVIVGGALSNGGNLVAWLRDTLDIAIDRKLDAKVARIPPDAHGLTVVPFLAGERSPDYRPDANAVFAGLRLATTRYDIVRAALEAVAYRFLAIFTDLQAMTRVTQIVATGTALQSSAVWVQILADVLGRPISVPSEGELTSRGAAIVALEQLGVKGAARPLRIAKTFTPDRRAHEIYRAAAARQRELIETLEARERTSTPKGQLPTSK
jgi:gluconokinase